MKLNKILNKKCFSSLRQIQERDLYFRDLLTTKEGLNSNELANIARVLGKANSDSITKEEEKKFDSLVVENSKNLDRQELRQVINYYFIHNKNHPAAFYELNQRYQKVGLKDYVPQNNSVQAKFWLALFGLRNKFIGKLSCFTGLNLK